MRVCFINPPRPWLVNPCAQAPIGILYLAAVLERAGHDVRIANLAGCQDISASPLLTGRPFDAYCITGTFLDVLQVNALAEAIRRVQPTATILAGGPIALSESEISSAVNAVVLGEAEADIRSAVVESDMSDSSFRPYICSPPSDLDALPFPARHLWAGPFGGNIFIGGANYFGGGSTTILSSRGCPYDCAFCASSALAPRKVRFRSAANVVEEMERCVADYGVRQFRFSDENFCASSNRVQALCEAIAASPILGHGNGIAWRASIAVHPVNAEAFAAMRDAGCKEVSIGVESADPRVLALICPRKLKSADEAMHALRLAKEAGLRTRALMMVGTPGESDATARLNIDFMRRCGADALAVTVFSPIPGCDIYVHPDRYGCRPRGGDPRSLCLYGPTGQIPIEPTIDIDDYPYHALRGSMRAQIEAAVATGRVGRG